MRVSIKDLQDKHSSFNMNTRGSKDKKGHYKPRYTAFNLYIPTDFENKHKKVKFMVPNWHGVNFQFRFYMLFDLLKDLYPLHDNTFIEPIERE